MGARMRFIQGVSQRLSGVGRCNGVWVEFWGIGRACVYGALGSQGILLITLDMFFVIIQQGLGVVISLLGSKSVLPQRSLVVL